MSNPPDGSDCHRLKLAGEVWRRIRERYPAASLTEVQVALAEFEPFIQEALSQHRARQRIRSIAIETDIAEAMYEITRPQVARLASGILRKLIGRTVDQDVQSLAEDLWHTALLAVMRRLCRPNLTRVNNWSAYVIRTVRNEFIRHQGKIVRLQEWMREYDALAIKHASQPEWDVIPMDLETVMSVYYPGFAQHKLRQQKRDRRFADEAEARVAGFTLILRVLRKHPGWSPNASREHARQIAARIARTGGRPPVVVPDKNTVYAWLRELGAWASEARVER